MTVRLSSRKPDQGMSEREAAELEAQIGRHVRFRVTGRRMVSGKGIHLDVVDTQSGYRHRIHSREHWRQIFNELVLLVEGAWEDVTLAAIAQLQQLERESEEADRKRVRGRRVGVPAHASLQRRRLIRRQWKTLLNALQMAQAVSDRMARTAIGEKQPPGSGGIRELYPGYWTASADIDGRQTHVAARTREECEDKLRRLKAGDPTLVRGVGYATAKGSVRLERPDQSLFCGEITLKGRLIRVHSTSYEECWEKLEAAKRDLLSQNPKLVRATPVPAGVPGPWEEVLLKWAREHGGVLRVREATKALGVRSKAVSTAAGHLTHRRRLLARIGYGVYRLVEKSPTEGSVPSRTSPGSLPAPTREGTVP